MSKEVPQHLRNWIRELAFFDGLIHQSHPAITGLLIDGEGGVSHSQLRVSPSLQVVLWTTEAKHQKQTQTFLGAGQILRRVHWAKQIIIGDLAIERGNQTRDSGLADGCVEFIFGECGRWVMHGRRIFLKCAWRPDSRG